MNLISIWIANPSLIKNVTSIQIRLENWSWSWAKVASVNKEITLGSLMSIRSSGKKICNEQYLIMPTQQMLWDHLTQWFKCQPPKRICSINLVLNYQVKVLQAHSEQQSYPNNLSQKKNNDMQTRTIRITRAIDKKRTEFNVSDGSHAIRANFLHPRCLSTAMIAETAVLPRSFVSSDWIQPSVVNLKPHPHHQACSHPVIKPLEAIKLDHANKLPTAAEDHAQHSRNLFHIAQLKNTMSDSSGRKRACQIGEITIYERYELTINERTMYRDGGQLAQLGILQRQANGRRTLRVILGLPGASGGSRTRARWKQEESRRSRPREEAEKRRRRGASKKWTRWWIARASADVSDEQGRRGLGSGCLAATALCHRTTARDAGAERRWVGRRADERERGGGGGGDEGRVGPVR